MIWPVYDGSVTSVIGGFFFCFICGFIAGFFFCGSLVARLQISMVLVINRRVLNVKSCRCGRLAVCRNC